MNQHIEDAARFLAGQFGATRLPDLGDVVRVSVHRIAASALDAQGLEDVTAALEDVSTLWHGPNGLMSSLDVAPAALCGVLGPWITAEIAAQERMEVRR